MKEAIINLIEKYQGVINYNVECIKMNNRPFYLIDLTIDEPKYIMDILIGNQEITDAIERLVKTDKIQFAIKKRY